MIPLAPHGPYHFAYHEGEGDDLVIAFASIGHDPARVPSPEFVGTATRRMGGGHRRALFVSDARRGWASDADFAAALQQALAAVEAQGKVARITAMGVSMGGYLALAAGHVLPLSGVLAFGPQFSVRPNLVPFETRWRSWVDQIPSDGAHPHVILPPCQALICHGAQDDWAQAQLFPKAPRLDHVIFPAAGHSDLVPHLKSRGLLPGLLAAFEAEDRRRYLRILSSAGGVTRKRYEGASSSASANR